MRSILTSVTLLLCSFAGAQPSAPEIDIDNYGTYVEIYWYSLTPDVNYRFYYAPYPSAEVISSIEVGTALSLEGDLPLGASFYIAVTAYNDEGESPPSNIEYFTVGGFNSTDDPNAGQDLTCPAGGDAELSGGWEALDLFNDTWQFSYNGQRDDDSIYKFCRDGSFLADGEIHDEGDGGTWTIDAEDGALLIDFDSEEYSDQEALFLQVSSSFARLCSTIILDEDLNRQCYSTEYSEEEEDGTILLTKTTPPEDSTGGVSIFSLDGQWTKVGGDHVIDCDTDAGSCITVANGSEVESVMAGAPSRVGMEWFKNIAQGEADTYLGDERWIRYDDGQFSNFFYLPGAIEITSPDFFIITSDLNNGLEQLNLNYVGDKTETYTRIGATGTFVAEKLWTSSNQYEPYVFRVNQSVCYTVDHTGDMPMVLMFPQENSIVARLEANSTQELCLDEGRYMLVADLDNAVLNLPTNTSFIPPDFDETFPPIQTSKFAKGELNEQCAEYGYQTYCPPDVTCVVGTTCLNPTLNGTWRRPDGRTVECDLDDGACDFVRFGDLYSSIKKLPSIINQPMLKNIAESDTQHEFTAQHRGVRSTTLGEEFVEFFWQPADISFDPPDAFTTDSGTYTRVD